jgi:hypothetical protein
MRTFPALFAGLLVVLAAAPAAAPARVPVDNQSFTLPAAPFCGFAVNVTVLSDNEQQTTTQLADGTTVTRVTGTLVESYTNTDTNKTVTRNVSGPTTTTTSADGATATFIGTGNNRLIFGPASRAHTGEPALVITTGRAVVDFTGNIATGFSLTGHQEDLCHTLAP